MEPIWFSPGSNVEVRTEDGAWVPATVLEPPARNPMSQEINQHDADVLKHGIKAKRKLPEILVEHSEDPTTGENHNGNGIIKYRGNSAGTAKKQCEMRGRQVENGCIGDIDYEAFAPESILLFSSMVERISKLQLDDDSDYIDDILGTLTALEKQGFDIKALENHLSKVKVLKLRFEDLKNQSNVVETKITEGSHEVAEHSETISVMDKELSRLEEWRRVVKEKRAKAISEASSLQSKANTLKKIIQSIEHQFIIHSS